MSPIPQLPHPIIDVTLKHSLDRQCGMPKRDKKLNQNPQMKLNLAPIHTQTACQAQSEGMREKAANKTPKRLNTE